MSRDDALRLQTYSEACLLPMSHSKSLSAISNLLLIAQLLYYVALATKRGIFKPFYSPKLLGGESEHQLHAVILPALI